MSLKVFYIGDPHFQINNLPEVELLLEQVTQIAKDENPDIIVIAGDILHTHERIHTTVLNKAYELIKRLRNITKTYVLVGNHDYISNSQFLTNNHWMNSFKEWDNVVIVDKVINDVIKGINVVFTPYVYPGRFIEALDTVGGWIESNCIFAHQEFSGCKMGAIVSTIGDNWPLNYPDVISGHIHSKQSPQPNIFYPGTPMQHAFGESDGNIVCMFVIDKTGYKTTEIRLDLPVKKIVYMDVEDIDNFVPPNTTDKIRVTLNGNYEQFKSIKKTNNYKKLIDLGVKIVFRHETAHVTDDTCVANGSDFEDILNNIISRQKNQFVVQAYDSVFHNKHTELDDIFFL
jgi:DNA repair exonuclease SbcCD nuclease subunit